MAKSIIYNKSNGSAQVINKQKTTRVKDKPIGTVSMSEVLPFRISFRNIGIRSVTGNVPPIGIAIIGFNNYIL